MYTKQVERDGLRHFGGSALSTMRPVIKFPHSRGVSGALYLQSAIAGVMFCPGCFVAKLPLVSGVEVWVLRNRNP